MSIVLMYQGALVACDAFTRASTGLARVGLFQNDWDPKSWHTITAVVPCNFSGYNGLHDLLGWSTAVMEGSQAVSRAMQRFWVHNGGPVQNYVFGYYVVDGLGRLVWAERDPQAPVPMFLAGTTYRCTPTFAQESKFGGE